MADNRRRSRRRRSLDETPELKPIEKSIAKYLRFSCPTKKGMLAGSQVIYFNGSKAVECLTESQWSSISTKALSGDSTKESKHPVCFSSKHDAVQVCANGLYQHLIVYLLFVHLDASKIFGT